MYYGTRLSRSIQLNVGWSGVASSAGPEPLCTIVNMMGRLLDAKKPGLFLFQAVKFFRAQSRQN